MTQRKLTDDELAKARRVYKEIGGLYPETSAAIELVNASRFLSDVISYGTSDGKPFVQVDRVPTAADIGRPVKVRESTTLEMWYGNTRFVGFAINGRYVVQSIHNQHISDWKYCIIDQESDK
jgi:hypothetical protein